MTIDGERLQRFNKAWEEKAPLILAEFEGTHHEETSRGSSGPFGWNTGAVRSSESVEGELDACRSRHPSRGSKAVES